MAMQTRRTFSTRIDIGDETRDEIVGLLNARLADTFDLYSQLKQAHWNIKGSDFIQLHELYDTVAESVLEFVDDIAERATALGGLALGTARMAAAASALEEYPIDAVEGMDTVAAIADRLAAYGASKRRPSSTPRTPPISSSRSRAPSTSTCGSSRRISRPDGQDHRQERLQPLRAADRRGRGHLARLRRGPPRHAPGWAGQGDAHAR